MSTCTARIRSELRGGALVVCELPPGHDPAHSGDGLLWLDSAPGAYHVEPAPAPPMDGAELAAIRARAKAALDEAPRWDDTNLEREALSASVHDVPALLAEVDRLEKRVNSAESVIAQQVEAYKSSERQCDEARAEVDRWRRRAEWAEDRVDGQAWVDLEAERDRLRAELAGCVWVTPRRMSGQPCVGGTRVTVASVAAVVGDGGPDTVNPDLVHEWYPGVSAEGAHAAMWWTGQQAARDRRVAAAALRQFADDEESDPYRCTWGYPALMRERADSIDAGTLTVEVDRDTD